MKTYVLYHGNCPDGCGAAMAAWLKLGDAAEYIPVVYGKAPPPIDQGSTVYILDFSYPRSVLENLALNVCKDLVVLDHHATAEKELEGMPGCHFDMSKSGAVLAWEYFHGSHDGCSGNGQPPEFFQYLQDRDLWQFKLPQSREVSMALRSYPMDFRLWSKLSEIHVTGNIYEAQGAAIDNLKKEGSACKRLTDQQVDEMCKQYRMGWFALTTKQVHFGPNMTASIADLPTYAVAPVANATVFFSEVGERLLQLRPDAHFAGYYMDRADGKRQWGLRSRADFDCSVIAKAMGGGGHKQAAGFLTDRP